ncbi:unnamed protein product [Adineta ricciae]|uniref:Envelope fusion glycoprotein n=1 Tax=Adineta ricciae TaxID=249248 RepID=A0A814ATP9_ADIRI|nr:unnamed protein product [Adineta ricciae]CAF1393386.1 unnamed protein product [Adineta ricciae]
MFPSHFHTYPYNVFSNKSTIAHPKTGLFLDYVGQYIPPDEIVHTSAIFPMTTTTCHFLPLSAAKLISSCNITRRRTKRLIDPITLGTASISLALSVANSALIAKLFEQMAVVKNSISSLSQKVELYGAQLVKITSRNIEIIEELHSTQKALNDIMPVLKSHSEAIHLLKMDLERLNVQFRHSFLYSAISQIYRNELTLSFLSPDDMHKVVDHVIQQGNLTFNSHPESLPVVEIITKLLVQQHIDFIPSSQYMSDGLDGTDDPDEIGRLIITSYFAVPKQAQALFHIYKLVTIPFYYADEVIELVQIPRYWGIDLINNTTMEWHDSEVSGCNLELMTSCRDNPPIRTISKDTCLDEIIENLPLSKCQTTQAPADKYFIRQLRDNLWITSSSKPIHCVRMSRNRYFNPTQQISNINEEIILPPVAIVNVTEGYIIACPGFTLVGRPVTPNLSSLVLLQDNGIFTKNISVINVHQHITENMTWFKKNVAEQERQAFIEFINQKNTLSRSHVPISTDIGPFGALSFNWILIGLAVLAYYIYRRKRSNTSTDHSVIFAL